MAAITIRGTTLAAGAQCKIIVPITATTQQAAVQAAAALRAGPGDLVELRLDALLPAPTAEVCACLCAVRAALGEGGKPLLATVRTAAEGGPAPLPPAEYAALCTALCQTGAADLIDVELSAGKRATARIAAAAKAAGVYTVYSSHDFSGTPELSDMLDTLCRMGAAGADIAKLAVMPHSAADAAALLLATARAATALPDTPLLTMAMGSYGAVTRVCGAAFGSCATFGTAGMASAPGQPDAAALRTALDAVAACLK